MYRNTVFCAVVRAAPDLTTPISCPFTATRHVSVSQGRSSGAYVVARKLLHCWHNDHALCTEIIIFIVLTF
jgi:hypothetical protein